jgi:hypothetical protein
MTWSSPHAKLKLPPNNSNDKQTIIRSKRNAMLSHDWLLLVLWVVLLILWEPLAPTPNAKIQSQIVFQDIEEFLYKFQSWFLNKTPIRMATQARERQVPPATTERCDIYDIFSLGRCDHSRFPLCYFLIRCPHSHLSNLSVKH